VLCGALAEVGRRLSGEVRLARLHLAGGLDDTPVPTDEPAAGQRATAWLAAPALVSVATLEGEVSGPLLELALACDLRLAAFGTTLSLPAAAAGRVPSLGATSRLVELLGSARALELCLTGRRVDADEALAWGLLTAVVPAAELGQSCSDLAAAVLAAPRDAVVETKALLRGAVWRTRQEQCEAEVEAQRRLLHAAADETADGPS
jgi:enoyl-CoA hydratase/carnithine racemase